MDVFNNKWVKLIILIVVILVIAWLACIVLEKIGGHFNLGAGVANSGFQVNLGGTK